MTTTTALLIALITLPLIILFWMTESKQQRAKRQRRYGHTYKTIANRLNISQTTARRYCLA